jgi:hypothetical protein
MEIYIFLRMGGERECMVVKPLDDCDDLYRSLAQFDAAKAQCFLVEDREKLLAVVEASFGTFAPFNQIVRSHFAEQLRSSHTKSFRDLFFDKMVSQNRIEVAATLSKCQAPKTLVAV